MAHTDRSAGIARRQSNPQERAPGRHADRSSISTALANANGGVIYELNTPLFTDYANKYRFVFVPEGARAAYRATDVFDFPVGTIIAKTFTIQADLRLDDSAQDIIETRLLIRRRDGWTALPYIWNSDKSDAVLTKTGGTQPVSWIDKDGLSMLIGGTNSGTALAMAKVAAEKKKLFIPIGAATAALTNEQCNAYTVHWAYDTVANKTGWYNNELQYYASERPENAVVSGGTLRITAANGQLLLTQRLASQAAGARVELPLPDVAGLYLVVVENATGRDVFRVVR